MLTIKSHIFERFQPTKITRTDILQKSPMHFFKKRVLQERRKQGNNMTLIIGAKTLEGVVVLSDTRLTTLEGIKKKGQKVFPVINHPNAAILVGNSGYENYYQPNLTILKEKFEKSVNEGPISERKFVEILKECLAYQVEQEIEWRKQNKRNVKEKPILPFVCIVGGRLDYDKKSQYVLYCYSSEMPPYYGDMIPIGIADYDAQIYDALIRKIIKTDFRYEDLPPKLVNQILFLIIRIVSQARWDVAEPIFAYKITSKGYDVTWEKEFFPLSTGSHDPKQYFMEVIETASEYFGKEKVPTLNELIKTIDDFQNRIKT